MKLRSPWMLALSLTLAAPAFADKPAPPAPSKPAPAKPAPAPAADAEFPIPKDAAAGEDAPGGGGKIRVYKIPRGRDAVVTEVKAALAAGGWTLVKDGGSPSGRAVRLEAKKGDKLYKASFTGDATNTALILTAP